MPERLLLFVEQLAQRLLLLLAQFASLFGSTASRTILDECLTQRLKPCLLLVAQLQLGGNFRPLESKDTIALQIEFRQSIGLLGFENDREQRFATAIECGQFLLEMFELNLLQRFVRGPRPFVGLENREPLFGEIFLQRVE